MGFERTIPARVRLGFLKCSRLGSEGNSFENFHRAEKTKGDISSLNTATFCLYHAKLETRNTRAFTFNDIDGLLNKPQRDKKLLYRDTK